MILSLLRQVLDSDKCHRNGVRFAKCHYDPGTFWGARWCFRALITSIDPASCAGQMAQAE